MFSSKRGVVSADPLQDVHAHLTAPVPQDLQRYPVGLGGPNRGQVAG